MRSSRFDSAIWRCAALSVLCVAACASNEAGLAGLQDNNDGGAGDTGDASLVDEGSLVGRVANLAAVSGKDGIEIASLVSMNGTMDLRLRFQRFDAQNKAIGDGVEIGRTTDGDRFGLGLTMATDGTLTRICWSPSQRVVCFEIGAATLTAQEIFNDAGTYPTLTFRADAWVLAVRPPGPNGVPAPEIRLHRLDPISGSTGGEPVSFPYSETYFGLPTLFVPTPSGYALVAGDTAFLYRLDPNLAVVGSPLDLGMGYWTFGALAANDTGATIGLSLPYATQVLRVDGNTVISRIKGDGGGKTGFPVALIARGTTFAAAWAQPSGEPPRTQVRYFDDVGDNAFPAEFSTGPSDAFPFMRLLETKNGVVAVSARPFPYVGSVIDVQAL